MPIIVVMVPSAVGIEWAVQFVHPHALKKDQVNTPHIRHILEVGV